MRCFAFLPRHLALTILVFVHSLQGANATAVPYLNPGFEFNHNQPNRAFPIPISSQCERIHLSWGRTNNETGPSPVAPYFMQVYSSTSSVPYIVSAGFGPTMDWDMPFLPNTQYQICMFDTNGVSGGCQTTYTVIPNTTTTSPTCQLPVPPTALSVSATVPNGAMFPNSQINQCETLSVTPQSGNPPYTLTVAPISHPPFNVTSSTKDAIDWQVALPVGFQFFLLLSSADGQMWANGPMNVGGSGGSACFAPGMINKALFEKVVIGASAGGIVVGLVGGLLGCFIFFKIQKRKRAPSKSYFVGRHHSRDNPTTPLKGSPPSRSKLFGGTFSLPSSPTATSIPLTPTSLTTLIPEVPSIPHEFITPPRRSAQRHRSTEPTPISRPSSPPSELGTSPSGYPADIKRPIPLNDEDADSVASSSMNSRSHHRQMSTHSRAPTYVPRSSQLRGGGQVAEETGASEMPPEYGRHTADPHLKYAPSILSSGNRF